MPSSNHRESCSCPECFIDDPIEVDDADIEEPAEETFTCSDRFHIFELHSGRCQCGSISPGRNR